MSAETQDSPPEEVPKPRGKMGAFCDAYLGASLYNNTDAARRAGYADPNSYGSKVRYHPAVDAYIKQQMERAAMSPAEVRARLERHATASLEPFLKILPGDGNYEFDLVAAEEAGVLDLLKKIKKTVRYTKDGDKIVETEIAIHDSQAALDKLAKVHGLYRDGMSIDVDTDNATVRITIGGKPKE